MKKSTLIIIFCLLVSGMTYAANKAPDFTLKNLNNKTFTLSDQIGDGPILLDFWAFYCKPCMKSLPDLDALYKKYEDKGLKVVTISNDNPKSSKKVKPYIGSHKFEFEVLLDPDRQVRRSFGGVNIPYTVLIDNEGNIVYQQLGSNPGDEDLLEKEILKLLDQASQKKEQGDLTPQSENKDGDVD